MTSLKERLQNKKKCPVVNSRKINNKKVDKRFKKSFPPTQNLVMEKKKFPENKTSKCVL